MSEFHFTPQAADDLFEIWSYIAGDDPGAADRVEKAILDALQFSCERPAERAYSCGVHMAASPLLAGAAFP